MQILGGLSAGSFGLPPQAVSPGLGWPQARIRRVIALVAE
jgi:hypothetical protein